MTKEIKSVRTELNEVQFGTGNYQRRTPKVILVISNIARTLNTVLVGSGLFIGNPTLAVIGLISGVLSDTLTQFFGHKKKK